MPGLARDILPRFYVPVDDQWETAVHFDYRMAAACPQTGRRAITESLSELNLGD